MARANNFQGVFDPISFPQFQPVSEQFPRRGSFWGFSDDFYFHPKVKQFSQSCASILHSNKQNVPVGMVEPLPWLRVWIGWSRQNGLKWGSSPETRKKRLLPTEKYGIGLWSMTRALHKGRQILRWHASCNRIDSGKGTKLERHRCVYRIWVGWI